MDERLGFRFSYAAMLDKASEAARIVQAAAAGECDPKLGFEVLDSLPVVSAWYDLIGNANGIERYNPLVQEAYWHGSILLEKDYDFSGIYRYITSKFGSRFPDGPPSLDEISG